MKNRSFGDYNIIRQIGKGALGTVYLAEHRFMKRHYVLKVLPEDLASDRGFIQRFEEGVAGLVSLEHPHIVKIHNVSYVDGKYFLVMDCIVDGMGETCNLSQFLASKEAPLDEGLLYSILTQVAEALDYAHGQAQPLIHQRLKLNNILIGDEESQVFVHLSDFALAGIIGINKILSRTYQVLSELLGVVTREEKPNFAPDGYAQFNNDLSQNQRLQQSFLQNYLFLAPEQKNGADTHLIAPTTDTYAFGVLAYYMLMRSFPEGVFEMPSERYQHYQYNWDALINACLQNRPERRPTGLVEALKNLLQAKIKIQSRAAFQPMPQPAPSLFVQEARSAKAKMEEPAFAVVGAYEEAESQVSTPVVDQPFLAQAPAPVVDQPPLAQVKVSAPAPIVGHPHLVQGPPSFPQVPVLKKSEVKRPTFDEDPGAVFRGVSQVTQYQPQTEDVTDIEPLHTDMVVIKGGDYQRGCNEGNRDEMPAHNILVDSFAMDIHPVTNEQFIRVLESIGGEKDHNNNDMIRLRESRIRRSAGKLSIESGYSKHPVVGVTWYGAVVYAKWVGKRLPTEGEWEIACRGGLVEMAYPLGKNIEKNQSNFFSADTTVVMSYPSNAYGLFDMVGNIYEWCQDWYGYTYYEESAQEPDNPKGPKQGVYRVLRGGCWKSLKGDLRCSHRHRNNPGTVNRTYGFRCAANVQ